MSDAPPPPSYDSLFGNGGGLSSAQQQQNGNGYPSASGRPPAFNPVYPGAGPSSSNINPHATVLTDNGSSFNGYKGFPPPGGSSSLTQLPYPMASSSAFPVANGITTSSVNYPSGSSPQEHGKSSSWWPFGGGSKSSQQASPQHNTSSLPYSQGNGSRSQYQPFPTSSSSGDRYVAAVPAQRHDPFQAIHYSSEEENELRGLFAAVDEDGDGHITIPELQSALLNDNWTPFKSATVQMLLRMFDQDVNDTIEFEEFRDMKSYVQQFQKIFDTYDADRSGTIDAREVNEALVGMGFGVSPQFCQFLCGHFNQNRNQRQPQQGAAVNLDSFIQICAAIKQSTAEFESTRGNTRGNQPAYENFLRSQLQRMR